MVPGRWTVQAGHDLCNQLELVIATALERSPVPTQLKSIWDEK